METHGKNSGRFHLDGIAANLGQILLEAFVVFPNAAVGRVGNAGVVILLMIADRLRGGPLQFECR